MLDLVFPNGVGKIEGHTNIAKRGFYALQIACDIVEDTGRKDSDGKRVMRAKYGFHTLRHFFASWLIEQDFSAKKVQGLLGHASIQMTFDTYGHLFPNAEDDLAKFAAAEAALGAQHDMADRAS